jgi:hypothetical protein
MYPSREQINHERKQFLKQQIMELIGDDMKTSVQLAKLIGVERYHLKYALMDLEAEGLLHHEPRGSKLYLYYKPKRHPLDEIFNHNLNIPQELIKESHVYTEKDTKHNLRHNVTLDSFGSSGIDSEGLGIGT